MTCDVVNMLLVINGSEVMFSVNENVFKKVLTRWTENIEGLNKSKTITFKTISNNSYRVKFNSIDMVGGSIDL